MVDLFFTITFIFSFLRSFSENVTSFLWSTVSQTMALDQSAREDSLSYCKIAVFHVLRSYFYVPLNLVEVTLFQ